MNEPLKNKKIRVSGWTNDVRKGDRCNICFHYIDVKSAVEWLRKALAEGNPNIPTDDLIDKAFEDVIDETRQRGRRNDK